LKQTLQDGINGINDQTKVGYALLLFR